jgi:hypothetical protein
MRNLYAKVLGAAGAVTGLLYAGLAHAQPFSPTVLGENIDTVSSSTQSYFSVLIEKFWPFLLGAVILIGVIVFGKRIVHSMFGR